MRDCLFYKKIPIFGLQLDYRDHRLYRSANLSLERERALTVSPGFLAGVAEFAWGHSYHMTVLLDGYEYIVSLSRRYLLAL